MARIGMNSSSKEAIIVVCIRNVSASRRGRTPEVPNPITSHSGEEASGSLLDSPTLHERSSPGGIRQQCLRGTMMPKSLNMCATYYDSTHPLP